LEGEALACPVFVCNHLHVPVAVGGSGAVRGGSDPVVGA